MRIRAWLIFTAVWACGTGAYAEAPALNRWAILATPQVQESGLADLLTAELGKEPGLTLVERDQIAAALKELTLDQALGAEATGQRLKLGKLLKADALLFLAEEQHEKDEFIRGVVSDSALGARLSTDFLPLATGGAEKLAEQIVALIRETRSRFPQGVLRIIGVPSFVSRDLTHDYDYLQDQLAYVLQSGLAAWPGQAVLEVEEARAIQRELDIAGDKLAQRVVPCFVEGEYRTTPATRVATQPAVTTSSPVATSMPVFVARRPAAVDLTLVVKDTTGVRETVQQRGDTIEALAAWLQREAPQRLLPTRATAAAAASPPRAPEPTGVPATQPSLTDAQQLALLASRAETFARQGDYEHSTALREACLLIWPDAAEQHRALAKEYGDLISPERVQALRNATDYETWLRQGPVRWKLALGHLEYVIRGKLATQGEIAGADGVMTRLRQTMGEFGQHVWQAQHYRPAYAVDASVFATVHAAMDDAEAQRRAFALTVVPLVEQLGTSLSWKDQSGAESSGEAMRGMLYDPIVVAERQWPTQMIPRDRSDLDFIRDALIQVARGRPGLVLFLPQSIWEAELGASRPAYSVDEFRAFVRGLDESGLPVLRFLARASTEVFNFLRNTDRGPAAATRTLSALRDLENEYLVPLGAMRPESDSLADELRQLAGLEPEPHSRITHVPDLAGATISPYLHLGTDPIQFVDEHGERVRWEDAFSSAEPARFVPCTPTFEVVWDPNHLYYHERAGVLRTHLTNEGEALTDVAWDGRNVWAASKAHELWILGSDGKLVAVLKKDSSLPPSDQGMVVQPLEPGRALVVGSFGPDCRAWCALVSLAGDAPQVDVFHEATRVWRSDDPPWLPTCCPDLAFRPLARFLYRPPNRPGHRLVLIERDFPRYGYSSNVRRHGLLVDPEARRAMLLPARHPLAAGQTVACLADGTMLVSSRATVGAVAAPGRRLGDGQLFRTCAALRAIADNVPPRTFTLDRYVYVQGINLGRYDPAAQELLLLGDRGEFPLCAALSVHAGLFVWGEHWNGYRAAIALAEDRPLTGTCEIEVRDARGSAPLSGATLEISTDWATTKHATDTAGRCRIELDALGARGVSIYAWKDGFAAKELILRGGSPPKDPHVLMLDPLIEVGGVVQDVAGKPLGSAQVFLLEDRGNVLGNLEGPVDPKAQHELRPWDYSVTADAQGRWSEWVYPSQVDALRICVLHPTVAVETIEYRELTEVQRSALRSKQLVFSVTTGSTLTGRVLDAQGQPVAAATVSLSWNADVVSTEALAARTDADGAFRFPDLGPRDALIVVQAAGFAPELRPVSIGPADVSLEIRLQPGTPLRGRVVDEHDQPLGGARLHVRRWRGRHDLTWQTLTDEAGRFSWPDAPHDELCLTVELAGFQMRSDVNVTAGETEHIVRMVRDRQIVVAGSVSDAASGQPVPAFVLTARFPWALASGGDLQLDAIENGVKFQDGRYRLTLPPSDRLEFWVLAEGCVPQHHVLEADASGEVELNLVLQKGQGPSAVVKLPDGTPVAGAAVKIVLPLRTSRWPGSKWGTGRGTTTDAQGRFGFPAQSDPYLVVVEHERGYVEATEAQLARGAELVLQPWGRIEGTVEIGPQHGAFETFQVEYAWATDQKPGLSHHATTKADAQGRFVFDRLPPGRTQLTRLLPPRRNDDAPAPEFESRLLEIRPGAVVQVAVRREGRPVTGKVVELKGLEVPVTACRLNGYLHQELPSQPGNWAQMSRTEQETWLQQNGGTPLDRVPTSNNLDTTGGAHHYHPIFVKGG